VAGWPGSQAVLGKQSLEIAKPRAGVAGRLLRGAAGRVRPLPVSSQPLVVLVSLAFGRISVAYGAILQYHPRKA